MLIKLNLQRDNCGLYLKAYIQILPFQLFTKKCGKVDSCLAGFFKSHMHKLRAVMFVSTLKDLTMLLNWVSLEAIKFPS